MELELRKTNWKKFRVKNESISSFDVNPEFRPVFREKEFFQINYLPKFSDVQMRQLEQMQNAFS